MAIINNRNIIFIRDAFSHFYPDSPADFVDGKYQSGDFSWKSRADFNDFVFKETKILIKSAADFSNLKAAQQAFEKKALTPEAPAEKTTPENLKALEEEAAKKEADRQKAVKDAEAAVKKAIDTQQKNYDKLKSSQKIFVKSTDPQKLELSGSANEFIEKVRAAPKEYVPILTEDIEKSITPSLEKELTKEQIHLIAEDSAFKAVDAAANPQKYIDIARQSAILTNAAKDESVIPKIITDADSLAGVKVAATEIGTYQNLQTLTPRAVFSAFNPDLAKSLFPDPSDFKIEFSQSALPGYTNTFDTAGLTQGYINFLGDQVPFFARLAGLPIDKVQTELVGKASGWIESQIASHFPQAAAIFNAPESRLILSSLGIGAPVTIELPAALSTLVVENPAALPIINFIGGSLGINFSVGSLASGVAGEVAAAAGGEALGAAGAVGVEAAAGAAVGAGAGAAIGSVVPIVGTIIGAVIGPKIVKFIKDNVPKVSKFIVAGAGAVLGGAIGASVGIGAITGGIIGGLGGYGAASFFSGGISGVQASLGSLGSGILSAIGAIWSTFLAGIGTPILAFLIGFPLVVALILFIINSGAYMVPPGSQELNEVNPYISVEKVAEPGGQVPSPTLVTYTVTITAKKDTLTGIVIKADCKAIKKGSTVACPAEVMPAPPTSINAGTPFIFSFTTNYGSQYQDSLVSNSVTVSAISPSGGKVSEVGSSSVCFGNCPLDCFDLSDPSWNQVPNLKSMLTNAASTLAGQYPNFAAKACGAGPVKLCYSNIDPPPVCTGGIFARDVENGRCNINFNKCVTSYGQEGVTYLLTHELTHHIQVIDGHFIQEFQDKVAPAEPSMCTYGGPNPYESMAEGDALFVARPVIYANASCVSNYQSQYPRHYNFAKSVMFAP